MLSECAGRSSEVTRPGFAEVHQPVTVAGGAMDLVAGVKRIFVITEHTTKAGQAKIVAASGLMRRR